MADLPPPNGTTTGTTQQDGYYDENGLWHPKWIITEEEAAQKQSQPAYEGDFNAQMPDRGYVDRNGIDNRAWQNIYKPTAYEYGGHRGVAEAEEGRYATAAALADRRLGEKVDNTNFNADRGLELGARGMQGDVYGRLAGMADGTGPSLAALQGRQQLDQSLAQQTSLAASARGGGANLAAAQRAASMGGAQATGNIANATAMARQAEQMGAINAMGGVAGQIRGQDQSRGGMAAQNAQFQAGINQQQHGLNDARNLSYEGMRQRTFEDQNAYQQSAEAANQGVFQAAANRQQAADEASAARTDKYVAATVTGLSAAATYGSDRNLKTDIREGSSSMSDALSKLNAYEYRYKDSSLGEGPRLGIMAQDFERSELGKEVVVETPIGKAIDVKKGLSFALAGIADLDKRLRAKGAK